jgi:hypothetical protein
MTLYLDYMIPRQSRRGAESQFPGSNEGRREVAADDPTSGIARIALAKLGCRDCVFSASPSQRYQYLLLSTVQLVIKRDPLCVLSVRYENVVREGWQLLSLVIRFSNKNE